jgi:hypothetical protein
MNLKADAARYFQLQGDDRIQWALKCRKRWGGRAWTDALRQHEARTNP